MNILTKQKQQVSLERQLQQSIQWEEKCTDLRTDKCVKRWPVAIWIYFHCNLCKIRKCVSLPTNIKLNPLSVLLSGNCSSSVSPRTSWMDSMCRRTSFWVNCRRNIGASYPNWWAQITRWIKCETCPPRKLAESLDKRRAIFELTPLFANETRLFLFSF